MANLRWHRSSGTVARLSLTTFSCATCQPDGPDETLSKPPETCADGLSSSSGPPSCANELLKVSISDHVTCDGSMTCRHRTLGEYLSHVIERELSLATVSDGPSAHVWGCFATVSSEKRQNPNSSHVVRLKFSHSHKQPTTNTCTTTSSSRARYRSFLRARRSKLRRIKAVAGYRTPKHPTDKVIMRHAAVQQN